MKRSLEESLALFESIRNFFRCKKNSEFVIEICDGPMSEWNVFEVHSLDHMVLVRTRLSSRDADSAGFMHFDGHYDFYYVDKNLYQVQNLDSDEILDFRDYTRPTYNLKLLLKEIRKFQGS